MKEVSEREFYAFVGPLDVSPMPVGDFPYTSIFKTRSGNEVARIVESFGDVVRIKRNYYIAQ